LLTSHGIPEKRIQTVQGAIEDETTCHSIIEKTVDKFGKIDVLVNNAGLACKPNTAITSLENFDYLFKVNVRR
jgi:NADP-dependent 3-hydroxy acid dehydrogenase YdfG